MQKQSIVAQFELRLEQLNAKLARKDDMLRTYDSDLALLALFKVCIQYHDINDYAIVHYPAQVIYFTSF